MEKKDLHNLIDTIKTNFDRMIHDSIKSIDNYIDKEENKIPEPEKGMWCYFWDNTKPKRRVKHRFNGKNGSSYLSTNANWRNCEICHDQWLPAKYKGIIKEGDLFIVKGTDSLWEPILEGSSKGLYSIESIKNLEENDQFLIIHREES